MTRYDSVEPSPLPYWTRLQYFEKRPWANQSREQWIEWCHRHGLDSHRIAIPGWIACDDELYRVYADTWDIDSDELVREVVAVQLEAPAMPFPVPPRLDELR